MGSGISTKYQIDTSYGTYYVSEKEAEYGSKIERVFDEDYLNDFFNDELQEPRVENASLEKNIISNKEELKFHENGRFGDEVKNGIDNYYSDNPMADAMRCYKKMAYGGKRNIRNTNDQAIFSQFEDGSFVQFRPISSSPSSPAVEVRVDFLDSGKMRKIHFVKK